MASLRKKPNTRFWVACFTDHDGVQRQRSTGTVDRTNALRIALHFEDIFRRKMGVEQVRRAMNDLCETLNGRRFLTSTTGAFFDRWIARKEGETQASTLTRYREVMRRFEKYLGPERWAQELSRLDVQDFAEFRDTLAKKVTPATANLMIKILSSAMKGAWRDGLIADNPAAKVERLKRKKNETERRPFTVDEVRLLLEHGNGEWKGIILCGLYTGQRLGDIVGLTWNNIDVERAEIRLTTQKTDRRVIVPMAQPLLRHFAELPSSDDPNAPIFPEAFAIVRREGRVNNLSNQFYDIMVAAGLATKRRSDKQKEKGGLGRDAKRHKSELVFHSLRHTATSLFKNAGVSEAVAMDLIGHDSRAVSQNYTHIDEDAKRQAIAKLPDILSGEPTKKPSKPKN
ncbi:MAG TPA: tyrosine-type recombinase/integrase [Candidatus Didemnitutus sp.]|jgi:integrase